MLEMTQILVFLGVNFGDFGGHFWPFYIVKLVRLTSKRVSEMTSESVQMSTISQKWNPSIGEYHVQG